MARFIGDDGPDVPADNLDPETLQPAPVKPHAARQHPAARGVHGLDWLHLPEAARWIGVHPNTLKRWCDDDEARLDGKPAQAPPFQRIGRRRDRRFRVTDLEQFVRDRVVESPRSAAAPVQP